MSCACSDIHEICVNEGSSKDYEATLKDRDDVVIPQAAVASLTLTLKDRETGTVINGRNAQNVLGVNGGELEVTSGLFTMEFSHLDNVIVTDSASSESHVATFSLTLSTGKKHQWDVLVKVKNLGRTEA